MEGIFVNGLQRTGTNYVRTILQDNTSYYVNEWHNYYWKHDMQNYPIYGGDREIYCNKIITVIKNPYTWVESICFRNPVDIVKWFPEYNLENNFESLGNFNINLISLITLYKDWYNSWVNDKRVILTQYENLLNSKNVKSWLTKNLNTPIENITIRTHIDFSGEWDNSLIKDYKQYKLRHLNLHHINTINEILGEEFINKIGYPIK